jgi:hypothetical protein
VNTCSVRCRYKAEGGSWSHNSGGGVEVLSVTATDDDFDVILPNIVSDPKVIYMVELNTVDDTNLPVAMEFNIPSEYVDVEFREGGKGLGLGKHATEENLLDCDWNAKFRKNVFIHNVEVADFVVEQGYTDIWYYRKWYSGRSECWGSIRRTVNIKEQWGNVYYGAADGYQFPPQLFNNVPICQVTAEFGSTSQAAWLCVAGSTTITHAPSVWFLRPNISNEASYDILYYAIGNWK